jgi:hypothetical protein
MLKYNLKKCYFFSTCSDFFVSLLSREGVSTKEIILSLIVLWTDGSTTTGRVHPLPRNFALTPNIPEVNLFRETVNVMGPGCTVLHLCPSPPFPLAERPLPSERTIFTSPTTAGSMAGRACDYLHGEDASFQITILINYLINILMISRYPMP